SSRRRVNAMFESGSPLVHLRRGSAQPRLPTVRSGAGDRPRRTPVCSRRSTLRSSKRRLVWLVALLAAVGLVAGACGSSSDSSSGESTDTTTSGESSGSSMDFDALTGSISGSGAAVPSPFYEESIGAFEDVASDLEVLYDAVGSGTGKTNLADGVTVWAGTDSLVSESDKGNFPREFLYFPTVAAPITVS